jgi:hypothetical protein
MILDRVKAFLRRLIWVVDWPERFHRRRLFNYYMGFLLRNQGLPPGFDQWDLADKDGWTLAHWAVMPGRLPPGFNQWRLADKKGLTVAELAYNWDIKIDNDILKSFMKSNFDKDKLREIAKDMRLKTDERAWARRAAMVEVPPESRARGQGSLPCE